jgi:predicted RND superfamily exporter protein
MFPAPKTLPPALLAVLLLLLGALAAWLASGLTMDNRMDRMLSDSGPEAKNYERFLKEYGSDEFVIVGITGKPLFDQAALDVMVAAYEELRKVPHVANVSGIPKIYLDRFGGEDTDALVEELTSTPFYFGLFLAPDQKSAGLLVETEVLDRPGMREELVHGVDHALQPLRDYGFTTYLVGVPVIGTTLNHLSMSESTRYFPLAAISSLISLLLLLRSVRAATTVVFCGALAILLTLGLAAAIGRPLNLVTSSVPLVLWVLALANCIHMAARYQHFRSLGGKPPEAARMAFSNVFVPCTLATITTAFGFLSLATASVQPVAEFGILMAAGMLISHCVNMILAPWMLITLRAPQPRWWVKTEMTWFGRLANLVIRARYLIIPAFTALILLGIYMLQFIKSEPNSLNFLPPDHPTVQAYNFVGHNLTGMYTLEILIETPGTWLNPDYWPPIEQLETFLESSDLVSRVVSPLGFLKKMNQWDKDLDPAQYRLPESKEAAEELWSLLGKSELDEIHRLVREDMQEIRMTALINSTEVLKFSALVDATEAAVKKLPAPMSAIVTGMVSRMEAMQLGLVQTQLSTFGLSFLLVFITIWIGMRSLRVTLGTVPPNVFPILTVFTVMVLLGISLDAGTVMVASISLGIAVDNTLHLVDAWRRQYREGFSQHDALRNTLVEVGTSVALTTITACIGFFTLTMSSFVPIVNFGLLCGTALIVALLADLFFTPALLAAGVFKD